MLKQPPLTVVASPSTGIAPPRPLGEHGHELWAAVQHEYAVTDRGGVELLAQACAALDRAEALAARIAEDGEVIYGKTGPKAHPAIKDEIGCRAFVCRTLQRLGLNVEAIKPVGRPGSFVGWRGTD
jgi:hypothetical protein